MVIRMDCSNILSPHDNLADDIKCTHEFNGSDVSSDLSTETLSLVKKSLRV